MGGIWMEKRRESRRAGAPSFGILEINDRNSMFWEAEGVLIAPK